MRHSRGIDLEPDTRGAYLTVSASAADLSEEQVLGARVAACDFRKWGEPMGNRGQVRQPEHP
jgi:hypothetical protein